MEDGAFEFYKVDKVLYKESRGDRRLLDPATPIRGAR
jgi:hypothetical protein